jgi:hypothetical protein
MNRASAERYATHNNSTAQLGTLLSLTYSLQPQKSHS